MPRKYLFPIMTLLQIAWIPGQTAARGCASDLPDQTPGFSYPGRRGRARVAAEALAATPSVAASTSAGPRGRGRTSPP
jgi:hypothetical protein